jgi:hypothetical protein
MDARRVALAILTIATAAMNFPRAAAWGPRGPDVVVVAPTQPVPFVGPVVGGVGVVGGGVTTATAGAVAGGGVVVDTPVSVQAPVTQSNVQIG